MAPVELRLLGGFHLTSAGQPVSRFRSNKVRALLAYLAVEARPHTRTHLVGLFWPELPEPAALNNLSQTLGRLQQALGTTRPAPPLVVATRQEVRLANADELWVDVQLFGQAQLLAGAGVAPGQRVATIAQLEEAVALYQGDLLAGFALPGCEEFENWLLLTRDTLQRSALDMLYTLAAFYLELGDYVRARHTALQQLKIDGWREEAHRQLMRALAADGQRAEALQQFERCCQLLRQEAGFEPEAATVALAAAIRRGAFDAAAPATLARPRHNLPGPLAPLIGRAEMLSELQQQLATPSARLLTIFGPGGVGKTRLALAVAQSLVEPERHTPAEAARAEQRFADGIWFVPLAGLSESSTTLREDVALAIVSALGFTTLADTQPAWAQLVAYLRQKRVLLVLDNVEHLPGVAGVVLELLHAAPHLAVLATSRARLGLEVEQLCPLLGLAAPPDDASVADESYSAVRLFLERARHTAPELQLDAESLRAVGAICRLVEGLPLGLELAAQWVDHFTCAEIAAAIQQNLDFLAAADPGAIERHGSLRAVFAYSWGLLDADEQRTLAQLAVFRGSFSRLAALAVAQASLSILTALASKSLVRLLRPGRYELHSLLRLFASEQLAAMEAEASVPQGDGAARHMQFYLDLLRDSEGRLYGSSPQQAIPDLWVDLHNLQQAWQYACQHAQLAALEHARASLARFFRMTGLVRAGAELFAAAYQACRSAALSTPLPASSDALVGGWLLVEHARFAEWLADFATGATAGAEALALAEQHDALALKAAAHSCLGALLAQQGQHRAARPHLETAVTLAQAERLPQIEMTTRYGLGRAAFREGAYDDALQQLDRALSLVQQLEDSWEMARMLALAGIVRYHLGESLAGREQLHAALRLFQRTGDVMGEVTVLQNLGAMAAEEGDYLVAQQLFERHVALMRELGVRQRESIGLSNLGLVAYYLGQHQAARGHIEQALQINRAIGDPEGEGMSLIYLALLHQQDEQHAAVQELAAQALQIARDHELRLLEANAWLYLGHARAGLGAEGADAAFERCIALQDELGHVHLAIEATAGLAQLALARDASARALALTEELLPRLEQHGFEGAFEPFKVYLTCYQILERASDPRARHVLALGRARLHTLTEKIADPALRASFVASSPAVRALGQLVETSE